MKGLSKRQREALIGFVLGDAYLQPTGRRNARLRLEHSVKQKDYIEWKYNLMKNFMQTPPTLIERFNPVWKRTYRYYRCQSQSSPIFGRLRRVFYNNNLKIVPENIATLLKSKFSLAVWYMDDGYYYHRDDVAYIYLSRFSSGYLKKILTALDKNFDLIPVVKLKKGNHCLVFDKEQTSKLIEIIRPYIIPSLRYKLPTTL